MNPIRKFFQGVGRVFAFIRATVLNIFVILLLIGLLAVLIVDDEVTSISSNSVLVLNPSGDLVEQPITEDPFASVLFDEFYAPQTAIPDIVRTLRRASSDQRIKMLVLDFSRVISVDIAQVERIRKEIRKFKDSGKPVWAYSTNFSQAEYLLSLDADIIALDPLGELLFHGVSMTTTYYKELLDNFGVDMNIAVQGNYKSAIEPYIRTTMSDEVKEVNLNLINRIWDRITTQIADARELQQQDILQYAEQIHQIDTETDYSFAQVAQSRGLIDRVVDRKGFEREYQTQFTTKTKPVGFRDYLAQTLDWDVNPGKIAILTIEGPILGLQTIAGHGQSETVRLIDKAAKNSSLSALVVHVRSPGGSVFESEYIRRALQRFKGTNRPLIAALAGTAASGGYWVSLPADEIFATPVTITGSIGVFSVYPTLGNALESVGVRTESLTTTPYANNLDLFVTPSPELRGLQQLQVDRYYSRFVSLVAESRQLEKEDVLKVAGGRIWLGPDAVEAGLVDSVGDLDDAINRAAELASLADYDVEFLTREATPFSLLNVVMSQVKSAFNNAHQPIPDQLLSKYREMSQAITAEGLFSICSYCTVSP